MNGWNRAHTGIRRLWITLVVCDGILVVVAVLRPDMTLGPLAEAIALVTGLIILVTPGLAVLFRVAERKMETTPEQEARGVGCSFCHRAVAAARPGVGGPGVRICQACLLDAVTASDASPTHNAEVTRCSFCLQEQPTTGMFAKGGGAICSECVRLAAEAIG